MAMHFVRGSHVINSGFDDSLDPYIEYGSHGCNAQGGDESESVGPF